MRDVKTRLERLEKVTAAEVRCVWLYVGWDGYGCPRDAGGGVHRVFVPTLPPALPPGLLVVLRHPDRDGAEVGTAAAAWALKQLALGPRQRALSAAAKVLVLVTAGGPAPPPGGDGAAPPGAAAGSPPVAEEPPPPAAPPPWPEWLPR
jgi:hypothetical protein